MGGWMGGWSLDFGRTLKVFMAAVCLWQVKQIEKRDSVLTSKQQIDRLLRPGASYFNLNPFEVSVFVINAGIS